jgi:cellulose synthase/poly-beta-1,6-N-acetylglucosamine synthase-like glycosyltransferase
VRLILILVQLPSLLMVLYLDVLSVAAALWRRAPPHAQPRNRFAFLVPAHNEEMLLPRLLDSLSALDYPRDLYDVYVVADNCTDRTAAVGTAGGARVHERRDERLVGKGHALHWLLAEIRESGSRYDAYVVLDADSVVSANFLQVMNRHLERDDPVIQSYYGVLNREESWSSALRYAGLALFNGLRPRGRDALGLSAGLRGNGMCFQSSILERFGWKSFTLAEDVEFHLTLVEAGIRVSYAAEASVLADMPTSLQQARSQNVRWERGRLQMLRAFGPRLLLHGIRRRDPTQLDALAEQLVPPLSVLSGVTVLTFALAAALRAPGPRRLASLVLLGQIGYVVTGLRLVEAGAGIYLALLRAPFYMAWKVWIYALAAVRLQDSRWIRTARAPEDS